MAEVLQNVSLVHVPNTHGGAEIRRFLQEELQRSIDAWHQALKDCAADRGIQMEARFLPAGIQKMYETPADIVTCIEPTAEVTPFSAIDVALRENLARVVLVLSMEDDVQKIEDGANFVNEEFGEKRLLPFHLDAFLDARFENAHRIISDLQGKLRAG
jgi:hypothetical protein